MAGLLIIFSLLFSEQPQKPWANFEALELYKNLSLNAAYYNEAIYIASFMENKILKVDLDGKKLSSYEVAGPGPNELSFPTILGINSQGVFVISHFYQVILLDHDLKPTKNNPPQLPFRANGGRALDEKTFLIDASLSAEPHALAKITLKDDHWTVDNTFVPLPPRSATPANNMKWAKVDNNDIFISDGCLRKEGICNREDYDISVCRMTGDHITRQRNLKARIKDLPLDGGNLIFRGMISHSQGFSVYLMSWTSSLEIKGMWLDRFDDHGSFMGRQKLDDPLSITSIQNSPHDMLLNEDSLLAYLQQ